MRSVILRRGFWTVAACFLLVLPLAAQNFSYTIPTTQPWTDTGLDLESGSVLEVTATPATGAGSSGCDPKGAADANSSDLPLATAPTGALIARLRADGPALAVGASQQLHVPAAGHLYFGVNVNGAPPCLGAIAVKVHISSSAAAQPASAESAQTPAQAVNPANSPSDKSNGNSPTGNSDQIKDVKGALYTAAQTWLSGQMGIGAPGSQPASTASSSPGATGTSATSNAAATPSVQPLRVSTAPLDGQLRNDVEGLPRRVNDQFNNLGDMVNFVLVGSQQKVQDTLTAANWHVADRDVKESVLKAALETYDKKAYLTMPMSELYLFGRVQDYGYEQAEPYAVVASRHHFRIWKAPFQWNGQEVWAGAGTHDIGFEKDQRNGKVTHKIDPAVDAERDNIGSTLDKTGKVKSMTYFLPQDPVRDSKNATGGGYHSDGRVLVIVLN